MFPITVTVDILGFLDRKELESVNQTNSLHHKIVTRYFSKTPLQRYDLISVWRDFDSKSSAGTIVKLQKSLRYRHGIVSTPEPERYSVDPYLHGCENFFQLPFIRFEGLFLTCNHVQEYLNWANIFRRFPHVFQTTKSLTLHFHRDPTQQYFAQLMNWLPLPSIERVEIEFNEKRPISPLLSRQVNLFNSKIFATARSVSIKCNEKTGLSLNPSDIVEWLHAPHSSKEARTFRLSGSFSSLGLSLLLEELNKIFETATMPCSYVLVIQFGYLKLPSKSNLFYWFLESQSDPANDPLVFWLQGGPGCSSLFGLITELGPFYVSPDGKTLFENVYSWNKVANVLFFDNPRDVGYSYTDPNATEEYIYNDDNTAVENADALREFLVRFPEYKGRDLYVIGESYAGVYTVTLTKEIISRIQQEPSKLNLNFAGLAIGNGWLSFNHTMNSYVNMAMYRGFIGKEDYDFLKDNCCKGVVPVQTCNFSSYLYWDWRGRPHTRSFNTHIERQCADKIFGICSQQFNDISGYDIYDANQDCYRSINNFTRDRDNLLKAARYRQAWNIKINDSPITDGINRFVDQGSLMNLLSTDQHGGFDCYTNWVSSDYLNRLDVRRAIHIPSFLDKKEYNFCGPNRRTLVLTHNYTVQYFETSEIFQWIFDSGYPLNILIYNGDLDGVANFLGASTFVHSLGMEQLLDEKRIAWKYQKESFIPMTVGYFERFQKRNVQLDLLTAVSGGHMLPRIMAGPGLQMLANFMTKGRNYSQPLKFDPMQGKAKVKNPVPPSLAISRKQADTIHDLPGLTYEATFKQYSGYLSGGSGIFLHYWFVESQTSPEIDPLVVWISSDNCSSMKQFLTEHGPFHPNSDGKRLRENIFAWNKGTNMLYLDTSASSFSQKERNAEEKLHYTTVNSELHVALKDFMAAYPEYINRDLYLASDSYTYEHLANLAVNIIRESKVKVPGIIKLAGLIIGNGISIDNHIMNSAEKHRRARDIDNAERWLNIKDIKSVLRTPENGGYLRICSDVFDTKYGRIRDPGDMFDTIIKSKNPLKILIYNGELDSNNGISAERFVEDLAERNLLYLVKSHEYWTYRSQYGGYVNRFGGSSVYIDFLTVKGAGRAVTMDRPGPALQMITNFITGRDYSTPVQFKTDFAPLLEEFQIKELLKNTGKNTPDRPLKHLQDKIWNLPGLTFTPQFDQYSGHLNGNVPGNYLFYWLFEAQYNRENAPLILWLSGGPGCSSLGPLVSEHGPFRAAYVVYLDSPRGVGFSYQNMSENPSREWNEELTAQDTLAALKQLYETYGFLNGRDLYITGESYAGVYVPTLVNHMIKEFEKDNNGMFNGLGVNLKGMVIGNGYFSAKWTYATIYDYLYFHGILQKSQWDAIRKCCVPPNELYCHIPEDVKCEPFENGLLDEILANPDHTDYYNIYQQCYEMESIPQVISGHPKSATSPKESSKNSQREEHKIRKILQKSLIHPNKSTSNKSRNPSADFGFDIQVMFNYASNDPFFSFPCYIFSKAEEYFDQVYVREALHVPDSVQKWTFCNDTINAHYDSAYLQGSKDTDVIFNEILSSSYLQQRTKEPFHILLYNGRHPWYYHSHNTSSLAGFLKSYEFSGKSRTFAHLDLLTVKGAGHFVPLDRPAPALQMLHNFLAHISDYSSQIPYSTEASPLKMQYQPPLTNTSAAAEAGHEDGSLEIAVQTSSPTPKAVTTPTTPSLASRNKFVENCLFGVFLLVILFLIHKFI
ncbi:serine carboxypeptidase domain-containing protein [Ditylenchus destructor]|nr:serine carboxypeptidase domain-containing protein [Ditylenchus destructor]